MRAELVETARETVARGMASGLLSARKPLIPVRVPVIQPATEVSARQANLVAVNIDGNAFLLTSDSAHALRLQLDKALLSPTNNVEIAVFDVLLATFGVSQKDVMGRGRVQPVAIVRQIGFWLLRNVAGLSWIQCGKIMGGDRPFDHGTAIHGVQSVNKRAKSDPQFNAALQQAKRNFEQVFTLKEKVQL